MVVVWWETLWLGGNVAYARLKAGPNPGTHFNGQVERGLAWSTTARADNVAAGEWRSAVAASNAHTH